MNKKGFTLVELLAVIVILGLVMTIVGTKGFGAFDNTKKAITKQNESAIKEAANVLMTEVKECDEELSKDIIENFVGKGKTCSDLKSKASTETCLDISLEYMIKNNFITGNGANDVLESYPNYTVKGCLDNEKITIKLPSKEELEKDKTPDEDNNETDNTLAAVIIKNAKKVTDSEKQSGFAEYRETPLTQPAVEISGENESTLSKTEDDYGDSYYFRGNVTNNYVDFAGMCWRIVRILGDGSIRLILEDQDSTCAKSGGNWDIPTTTGGRIWSGNFGYTSYEANTLTASDDTQNTYAKYLMNYLESKTQNDKSMATSFKNFQTGPLVSYLSYMKVGDWCLNDKAYGTETDNTTPLTSQETLDKQIKGTSVYYDSYVRLYGKTIKEPTLKCNGTVMTKFADNTDMYVGTLTADEIIYAGGKVHTDNLDYYLINDYQKSKSLYFWSLSPNYFNSRRDYALLVNYSGYVGYSDVDNNSNSFRPTITLKSSVITSQGDGTKTNAYKI